MKKYSNLFSRMHFLLLKFPSTKRKKQTFLKLSPVWKTKTPFHLSFFLLTLGRDKRMKRSAHLGTCRSYMNFKDKHIIVLVYGCDVRLYKKIFSFGRWKIKNWRAQWVFFVKTKIFEQRDFITCLSVPSSYLVRDWIRIVSANWCYSQDWKKAKAPSRSLSPSLLKWIMVNIGRSGEITS